MLFSNYFNVEYDRYITNALALLQKEKPQVKFYFLISKTSNGKAYADIPGERIVVKSLLPGLPGNSWNNRKMHSILKKIDTDLLLTIGGIANTGADIPQCIWVPGHPQNNHLKKKYFALTQKKLPQTMQQISALFTDTLQYKKILLQQFPSADNKIIVIPAVADSNYYPISMEEKENVKATYTKGREYFLFMQTAYFLPDLVNLLKAFSQFKKRLQSNMQLMILDTHAKKNKEFISKLEAFKYREDVHIYDQLEEAELKRIWASAYVLLHPSGNSNDLLNSFGMNTPVIINADKGYAEEIAAGAVLHASFTDHEQLASQLMLLYKNETLRNELIKKAREKIKQFNPQQQVNALWNGLVYATNN